MIAVWWNQNIRLSSSIDFIMTTSIAFLQLQMSNFFLQINFPVKVAEQRKHEEILDENRPRNALWIVAFAG